jgi:hypothetical protein
VSMAKRLPNKIDLFLTAEIVREETGHKLTLIGLITDKKFHLPPATSFPVAIAFAFVAVFFDGEGDFKVAVSFAGPDGIEGPQMPISPVTKLPDQAMNVSVNVGALAVQGVGKHTVHVRLDDRIYSEHFYIAFATA